MIKIKAIPGIYEKMPILRQLSPIFIKEDNLRLYAIIGGTTTVNKMRMENYRG